VFIEMLFLSYGLKTIICGIALVARNWRILLKIVSAIWAGLCVLECLLFCYLFGIYPTYGFVEMLLVLQSPNLFIGVALRVD
jgi:hypothetical protein